MNAEDTERFRGPGEAGALRPNSEPSDPPRIEIRTGRHYASVDPPVLALKPLLENRRSWFQLGGSQGYSRDVVRESLCTFDVKGRLIVPTGLILRLTDFLKREGYDVAINDLRARLPNFECDERRVCGLSRDHQTLVRSVEANPLGQIEVKGACDALETSTLICRVFPRARFILPVATTRRAQSVWRHLERTLGERVGLTAANVDRRGKRLLVGTYTNIGPSTHPGCDAILVTNAEEAIGLKPTIWLARMDVPRRYAIVDALKGLNYCRSLRLEVRFGPFIDRLERLDSRTRVIMLPTPRCKTIPSGNALAWKRAAYWHNSLRNALIGEMYPFGEGHC